MTDSERLAGSRKPSQSPLSRPVGFDPERDAIVLWLRKEASFARHAQGAETAATNKIYRMGQKDAYLMAADAIERGHYAIAMEAPHARKDHP